MLSDIAGIFNISTLCIVSEWKPDGTASKVVKVALRRLGMYSH
jgi:hypothetical protein